MLGKLFAKVQGDVYETSLDGSIIKAHSAQPSAAEARINVFARILQYMAGDGASIPPAPAEPKAETGTPKPTYTKQNIIDGYGDERATDGGL